MTVAELIEALREYPGELVVCVTDWGESYRRPHELERKDVGRAEGEYTKLDWTRVEGECLSLGKD